MGQEYSIQSRANDPHAMPDIEVFQHPEDYDLNEGMLDPEGYGLGDGLHEPGYYWRSCLPGCLPDSEPMGPFDTYAEALADAREGLEDE